MKNLKYLSVLNRYITKEDIFSIQSASYMPSGEDKKFRFRSGSEFYVFQNGGRQFFIDTNTLTLFSSCDVINDIILLSKHLSKKDTISILTHRYGRDKSTEALEELNLFVRAGFIHQGRTKPESITRKTMRDIPLFTLVLGLTNSCNLSCSYCFEKQDGNKRASRMTRETASNAIDWFLSKSLYETSPVIRFFGGEPLLNLDVLEFAASYSTRQARKLEKKIRFVMSTNGTLLTDKAIGIINRYNIGVCVSLDGPQRVHDLFRKNGNGFGSYNQVIHGITRLMSDSRLKVAAQAVLTNESDDLHQLVPYFSKKGFRKVYFGFVDCKKKTDYSLSDGFLSSINNNNVELITECMAQASPCRISISGHDTVLRRLYHGFREYHGCPHKAGINMVYVDPAGNVFPCYRLTSRDFRLGNVTKGMDGGYADDIRHQFANDYVNANECAACSLRHLCGGKCRANYSFNNGDSFPDSCSKRDRMDMNLRLFTELWSKNRRLLKQLYHKEKYY